MPQNVGSLILDLDKIFEDECKHTPLTWPWTITSNNESLTVIITCLKWTLNNDFSVRVTAHPQGAPIVSKQIDLDDHHPLLRPLRDVPNLCEAFPAPQLSTHHIHILGELMEQLNLKFD